MRRFFVKILAGDSITITGQDARHISRVLRLTPGTAICLVDPGGKAVRGEIQAVLRDEVLVTLVEAMEQNQEPPVKVWLAQGLPKGDKLEVVIQKAVEMGVAGVIPMALDFCTVKYDEAKGIAKVERWQKIAQEAAKQCQRQIVPVIAPVRSLQEVLANVGPDTAIILLYEGQTQRGIKEVLADCQAANYLILIGSEGGFSQGEVELITNQGGLLAGLGPRILRTETAALATLAIVMYEKGDLGQA